MIQVQEGPAIGSANLNRLHFYLDMAIQLNYKTIF